MTRVLYSKQFGIDFSYVDFSNLKEIRDAIIPGKTKMIFSESPCNPTLQLADLKAISELCKQFSKVPDADFTEIRTDGDGPSWRCLSNRILHVTDVTLAPPCMMRGLDFGADVVLISLTKYYCGHNMHLGGALVTKDFALHELISFKQNVMGSIMTPATAYAILQTSKTMALRVGKQSANAMAVAQFLCTHPKVLSVTYPGLPSHPQHALAKAQHRAGMHGGLIACEMRGGSEAGRRVMNACTAPWTLAENLGPVESIMTCPSVFTHGNMPRENRLAVGITDGLIRLSVGIEEEDDLIASLGKALDQA